MSNLCRSRLERWALVALLALALALAGCSDGSDGGSSANDTITAATAETITASELEGASWSYSDGTSTYTLEFGSDGNVTWSYVDKGVDYGEISYSDSYKYNVDGSMVTIYYDDDGTFEQLIYSSGQLLYSIYDEDTGEQFTMTFTKS